MFMEKKKKNTFLNCIVGISKTKKKIIDYLT